MLETYTNVELLTELLKRMTEDEAVADHPLEKSLYEEQPIEMVDAVPINNDQSQVIKPGLSDNDGFPIICSVCKSPARVPFKPNDKYPVYCRECYDKKRKGEL